VGPLRGFSWRLEVDVGDRYPMDDGCLRARVLPGSPGCAPVAHPHVDPATGLFCAGLEGWSPALSTTNMIVWWASIFAHPDASEPPANAAAAALLAAEPAAFYAALRASGSCTDGSRDAAKAPLTPARSPRHAFDFVSALILTAQNGFGGDVGPLLALSHETWVEEALWASPSVKDFAHGWRRRTRLMHAAKVGDVARLRWLLARRASVEQRDVDGRTALYFAALEGRLGAARELLAGGAALDACKFNGATPLYAALAAAPAGAPAQAYMRAARRRAARRRRR
jgi:ubiquitin-protein ligase